VVSFLSVITDVNSIFIRLLNILFKHQHSFLLCKCFDPKLFSHELYDCFRSIKVLAKIESLESLHKLEEIVRASDGIMVARGDLGVEIPLEQIPTVQEDIIYVCRQLNKPVIVASQLLESMVEYPTPTRAEVKSIFTSRMIFINLWLNGEYLTMRIDVTGKLGQNSDL